jgi:hypothetical protein
MSHPLLSSFDAEHSVQSSFAAIYHQPVAYPAGEQHMNWRTFDIATAVLR